MATYEKQVERVILRMEKTDMTDMRIFHWSAKVGYKYIADGYLLAQNRKDAEEKLKHVPFHDTHEEIELDDDCGYDGCEIDKDGVAIRWMD